MSRLRGWSPRDQIQRIQIKLLRAYFTANLAIRRFHARHPLLLEAGGWGLLLLGGLLAARPLEVILRSAISPEAFDSLQTVIVTLGGALIGATAIVLSFILFAMQVNVERLPHGLFRRFSSDTRLLSAFGASFAVAIAGTALSLIQDRDFAVLMVLLGVFATVVVLRLLFGAFRRSLVLVSPIEQLRLIQESADYKARTLERRLDWVIPKVEEQQAVSANNGDAHEREEPQLDTTRYAILHANAGWQRVLRETIGHAIAYAPSQDLRDRAARDIREKAETIRTREFELRSVERVLAQNDRKSTQHLLRELANILSPATAKEPADPIL